MAPDDLRYDSSGALLEWPPNDNNKYKSSSHYAMVFMEQFLLLHLLLISGNGLRSCYNWKLILD